jgi:hypothetical protein
MTIREYLYFYIPKRYQFIIAHIVNNLRNKSPLLILNLLHQVIAQIYLTVEIQTLLNIGTKFN